MPYNVQSLDPLQAIPSTWMAEMGKSFRRLSDLLNFLQLDPSTSPFATLEKPEFPLLVPLSFASRMRKGDWLDPLLAQILPIQQELQPQTDFVLDAVGDGQAQCAPGLLHKYANRVLIMPTSVCAIHCRYCFRRHYPYQELPKRGDAWQPAWDYLSSSAGKKVEEIILSGGDPLSLDNRRLKVFFDQALSYDHIESLRLHSRWPIVLPARIDHGFVKLLEEAAQKKSVVMVVHSNHAQEWDDSVDEVIREIQRAGVLVLNQSVLLRGVNDTVEALTHLSKRLLSVQVLPYYLHLLDRVQGTAHFEVEENRAAQLLDGLRQRVQGYAVPRLVREIAGEPHKTVISA